MNTNTPRPQTRVLLIDDAPLIAVSLREFLPTHSRLFIRHETAVSRRIERNDLGGSVPLNGIPLVKRMNT